MRNQFRKNIFREFTRTPARFIAIFLITLLGAGFLSGLQSTPSSMRNTADKYFEETELADYRIQSPLGFTDADVDALRSREWVDEVMAGQKVDMLMVDNVNVENTIVASIHSLPGSEAEAADHSYISRPELIEGRMPVAPGECIADSRYSNLSIGSTVSISDLNDESSLGMFKIKEFKVVGRCVSPVYIAMSRGNTTLGSGRVSTFFYVPEETFNTKYYTQLSLTLKEAEGLSAFSGDYADLVEKYKKPLEDLGVGQSKIRYEDLRAENLPKITKAESDYRKAKSKADSELSNALGKLNKGESDYSKGKAAYDSNAGKLKKSEADIATGTSSLEKGKAEYQANLKKWQASEKKYKTNLAAFNKAKKPYDDGMAKLRTAKADYSNKEKQLATAEAQYQKDKADLEAGKAYMSPAQIAAAEARLNAAKAAIDQGRKDLAVAKTQISSSETKLSAKGKEVAAGRKQIDAAKTQLDNGKKSLDDAKKKIDASESKLKAARADLSNGKAQLANASKTLQASRKELDKGWSDYRSQKAAADKKLKTAQRKITAAKRDLADLKEEDWVIMDRADNPGYPGFGDDANRINSLSMTVPGFMFLIAALVCLTTMTRMVEEQRLFIGTLKALGYSRRRILGKYMFYAIFLSLYSGFVGIALGVFIFPHVIWAAYSSLYSIGGLTLQPNVAACIVALLGGLAATTIATAAACLGTLKSPPAVLMRPKAPKAGRRVLLERVGFIWKRISFIGKVTLRNLFRYKKRFVMTVLGVFGCTAMLLTGFGLRDSVGGMADKQFNDIEHRTALIFLEEPSAGSEDTELNRKLSENGSREYIYYTAVDAEHGRRNNNGLSTFMYVPEDTEQIKQFVTFRRRADHAPVAFPPKGSSGPSVVVTEKLASALGVRLGDTMDFGLPGKKLVTAEVGGIVENYIYNYIYLSPGDYEKLYGYPPDYRNVVFETGNSSREYNDKVISGLMDLPEVRYSVSTDQVKDIVRDVVSNLNAVVWVIIAMAALLAMVVLYNLSNINITEREREIATLKVLGFHGKEVFSYIFRESLILTVIGMALGLGGGILLHRYVVQSVEVSEIMFVRDIAPLSYVYAALFTLLCSFLVNLIMLPKLRRIDPVSSLKSAE